jgi:hypothetical protein
MEIEIGASRPRCGPAATLAASASQPYYASPEQARRPQVFCSTGHNIGRPSPIRHAATRAPSRSGQNFILLHVPNRASVFCMLHHAPRSDEMRRPRFRHRQPALAVAGERGIELRTSPSLHTPMHGAIRAATLSSSPHRDRTLRSPLRSCHRHRGYTYSAPPSCAQQPAVSFSFVSFASEPRRDGPGVSRSQSWRPSWVRLVSVGVPLASQLAGLVRSQEHPRPIHSSGSQINEWMKPQDTRPVGAACR